MKAVIPAAGAGTRLRPHTLNKPKALLPVAGKPILAHIVDDLVAAGIDECVIVVGYHGDAVRRWFATARAGLKVSFVEQKQQLGLGHAVWTARDLVGDEPFFCILGDTILKADYGALLNAADNAIAVREVEDPRRFGVVELEGDRVRRFVEKPDDPPSNLAIVGAYLFRDAPVLWRAMADVIGGDVRTKNEYQLTDGLQGMIESGATFVTVPVAEWYDCGKPETWLATNRVLLDREAPLGVDPQIEPPCYVAPDAVISGSRIGPHVSVGAGARIVDCELSDSVIGAESELRACRLDSSLVGDRCRLHGVAGTVNIGDFCEVSGAAR